MVTLELSVAKLGQVVINAKFIYPNAPNPAMARLSCNPSNSQYDHCPQQTWERNQRMAVPQEAVLIDFETVIKCQCTCEHAGNHKHINSLQPPPALHCY